MFYKLITPFKSRQNGQDVTISELEVPEVVTVAMMRKVDQSSALMAAHTLTEACAKLSMIDGSKLESPDAIGYSNLLTDKLTPDELIGFELPLIRPVKSVIAKLTADINTQSIEFAAQVLEHSGMKREDIDAMPIGQFLPAVNLVKGAFIGPKS